jgi:hypothetical protein
VAGRRKAGLPCLIVRSLKTKFALTAAALAILAVVACVALAIMLRRRGVDDNWPAAVVAVGLVAISAAAWVAFMMGRRITRRSSSSTTPRT